MPRLASLTLGFAVAVALLIAPDAQAATLAWPVDGTVIASYLNGDDPYVAGMHRGIDIAAPLGTSVRAAVGGSVSFAGRTPGGALDVTIRSRHGALLVSHLHLESVAVRRGESVAAGRTVGTVGRTGLPASAQPHVHLGVRLADTRVYVDPLPLLPPRAAGSPMPSGGQPGAGAGHGAESPAPTARQPSPARAAGLPAVVEASKRVARKRRLLKHGRAVAPLGRPVRRRNSLTGAHPQAAPHAGNGEVRRRGSSVGGHDAARDLAAPGFDAAKRSRSRDAARPSPPESLAPRRAATPVVAAHDKRTTRDPDRVGTASHGGTTWRALAALMIAALAALALFLRRAPRDPAPAPRAGASRPAVRPDLALRQKEPLRS